ncbi:MAG: nucleoside deaminase [Bacteroidales bacterium]
MDEKLKNKFMRKAIELSIRSIKVGGGPFGAIIVKDGKIISRGENRVVQKSDPTAHAEIGAIRQAASRLHTHDLSGCKIFTSCEPCPMCLSAIYWANINEVYYACTIEDAEKIYFRDSYLYSQLSKKTEERDIISENILREEGLSAFMIWEKDKNKTTY